MAYTTTGTGSLGGSSGLGNRANGAGLVQVAYDRLIEFELRDEPLLRAVADKRPAKQAMPGDVITLQRYVDMSKATTPLTEGNDITAPAIATPTQTQITLQEFGNAAIVTRKLQLTSLADVDPDVATLIARNMADSVDDVVMAKLITGTNVIRSGAKAATNLITASDVLTAADIRKAVAKMRSANASGKKGSLFWCGLHPEASHDLRAATGAGSWRLPHEYQSGDGKIWAGEIGQFEGAYFVESPRLYNATDGASSARVYRTILAGKQALAEAVAEEPHTVIGPVTDTLKRFRPIGWYGVLGFSVYRDAALYRIESGSSIAS